jgi:hypothetical protein
VAPTFCHLGFHFGRATRGEYINFLLNISFSTKTFKTKNFLKLKQSFFNLFVATNVKYWLTTKVISYFKTKLKKLTADDEESLLRFSLFLELRKQH